MTQFPEGFFSSPIAAVKTTIVTSILADTVKEVAETGTEYPVIVTALWTTFAAACKVAGIDHNAAHTTLEAQRVSSLAARAAASDAVN